MKLLNFGHYNLLIRIQVQNELADVHLYVVLNHSFVREQKLTVCKPKSPSCGRHWLEWKINHTSAIALQHNRDSSQTQHSLAGVCDIHLALLHVYHLHQPLILYHTYIDLHSEQAGQS